jgi:translation initiation factor IF-3
LSSPYTPGFRGSRFPRRDVPPDTHRINTRIIAREVRVISSSGEQLGVFPIRDAIALAEKEALDLVEVAANAQPPVCRIMDYGKFKYKEQKKEAEARKKRTETTVKELRIRYITDVGDLETKLKRAREFIAEGDKVKFSMRFKGREIAYLDLGAKKFDLLVERLADVAAVDERSPVMGRMMYIVFAPAKKK